MNSVDIAVKMIDKRIDQHNVAISLFESLAENYPHNKQRSWDSDIIGFKSNIAFLSELKTVLSAGHQSTSMCAGNCSCSGKCHSEG